MRSFVSTIGKDGGIVKAHDDLLDATRYGVIILRMAKVARAGRVVRRELRVAWDVKYDVFVL